MNIEEVDKRKRTSDKLTDKLPEGLLRTILQLRNSRKVVLASIAIIIAVLNEVLGFGLSAEFLLKFVVSPLGLLIITIMCEDVAEKYSSGD